MTDKNQKRVATFGTYDLFHIGHLRILERARALGGSLFVGVSSDALNLRKKSRRSVFDEQSRMAIVNALACVDRVFLEESLELKRQYLVDYNIDILVMGDDWAGRFDEFNDLCDVIYLQRTPGISTTELNNLIRETRPEDLVVDLPQTNNTG